MRSDLAHIRRFTLPPSLSRAPLLVPFCHVADVPSILLLLRGGVDGLLPSEPSFPGGQPVASGAAAADAAVAQACEELLIERQARGCEARGQSFGR